MPSYRTVTATLLILSLYWTKITVAPWRNLLREYDCAYVQCDHFFQNTQSGGFFLPSYLSYFPLSFSHKQLVLYNRSKCVRYRLFCSRRYYIIMVNMSSQNSTCPCLCVTISRWEFCDIPICGALSLSNRTESETCVGCTLGECGTERSNRADYRGTMNTTTNGYTCQRWDSLDPSSYFATFDADKFGLESNYCRNPDNSRQPWCPTTDPEKDQDFCDVPFCEDTFVPRRKCGTLSKSQSDYRGDVSVSNSGQPWQWPPDC